MSTDSEGTYTIRHTHTHVCVVSLPFLSLASAEVYYELSVEKVCQFYAVLLLRQAGKVGRSPFLITRVVPVIECNALQFNYSEFMESWQQSVPLGMETDLSQLRVSLHQNSGIRCSNIRNIIH